MSPVPEGPRTATDDLAGDPHGYGFFQAVRLLQRVLNDRSEVGRFAHPGDEVVRFHANPELSFPAGEIQELLPGEETGEPWDMQINFLGLVGHMGVLPHHYSRLVSARNRQRDHALGDFLDLFHHRLVSLFYRAWERYRFYAPFERGEADPVTDHLFDLLGLGEEVGRARLPQADELLGYVGLLAPQQRGAVALEQMIEDYFGVPVDVEQFIGAWYNVSETAQCKVDDSVNDHTNRLGIGALVGDEIWDPQARARIVMGPLSRSRYEDFLPTGAGYKKLQNMTQVFSGEQIEYELLLKLEKDDVKPLKLGADDVAPLGWGTWIRSGSKPPETTETALML